MSLIRTKNMLNIFNLFTHLCQCLLLLGSFFRLSLQDLVVFTYFGWLLPFETFGLDLDSADFIYMLFYQLNDIHTFSFKFSIAYLQRFNIVTVLFSLFFLLCILCIPPDLVLLSISLLDGLDFTFDYFHCWHRNTFILTHCIFKMIFD